MPRQDDGLLTQAEYARHRKAAGLPGGSREAVRKAVDEKRITLIAGKIHPRLADEDWERNTRARLSPQAAAAPAGVDLVDQAASAAPSQTESPAAGGTPAAAPPADGYTAARARREVAEAEQAEIALKERKGELVARIDVDRAGFEIGRDLRDTMESAVNGLAAELAAAGNADKCAEVLRRHNRAVCEVLVKGWRTRMGAALQLLPQEAGG